MPLPPPRDSARLAQTSLREGRLPQRWAPRAEKTAGFQCPLVHSRKAGSRQGKLKVWGGGVKDGLRLSGAANAAPSLVDEPWVPGRPYQRVSHQLQGHLTDWLGALTFLLEQE